MQRLTHILKLILLGPQPKDELYDEWSKDPLAEWFREQRLSWFWLRANSWKSHFRDNWRLMIPAWAYLFAWLFLPARYLIFFIVPLMVSLFFMNRVGWKDSGSGHRPRGDVPDLFRPNIRVAMLKDLWMAGVQGRDIARLVYLEKQGIDGLLMIVILCMVVSSIIVIVNGRELADIMVLLVLVGVCNIISGGYCFHRARNPFRTWVWGLFGAEIPGVRAMQRFDFSNGCDDLNKFALPLWPLLGSPIIMLFMLRGVMTGLWHPATLHYVLIALMVLSVALIHLCARGRRLQDMQQLADGFEEADRDFDQWVRKELIGDEDAEGT
jgi:hypothetical protein